MAFVKPRRSVIIMACDEQLFFVNILVVRDIMSTYDDLNLLPPHLTVAVILKVDRLALTKTESITCIQLRVHYYFLHLFVCRQALYGRWSKMKRPTVGIATDGAHSTKERLTRYRAVDHSSVLELFNYYIGSKTNNIGDFLAIVEAVKYILRHPEAPRIIYSDSITAITWYRNKQTASSRRCEQLQLAEIFLKVMAAKIEDIQVLHWDNREWGETPADFGNK